MSDHKYEKAKIKEFYIPEKKNKNMGIHRRSAVSGFISASDLCHVKPVVPLYDRPVAKIIPPGTVDIGQL